MQAAIRVPTSTRMMLNRGAGLADAPGSGVLSFSDQRWTVVSFSVTTRVLSAPNATESCPECFGMRAVNRLPLTPPDLLVCSWDAFT